MAGAGALRGLDLLGLRGAGPRSYLHSDGQDDTLDDHDHQPDGDGFVVTVRRRSPHVGLGGPLFAPRRVHVARVDGWWREVRHVRLPSSLLPARAFPDRELRPGRPLVPDRVRVGARVQEHVLTFGALGDGAGVPVLLLESDLTAEVLGERDTPFGRAWHVRTTERGAGGAVVTDDLYLPGVGLAASRVRVQPGEGARGTRWLVTPPGPLRDLLELLEDR